MIKFEPVSSQHYVIFHTPHLTHGFTGLEQRDMYSFTEMVGLDRLRMRVKAVPSVSITILPYTVNILPCFMLFMVNFKHRR